MATRSGGVRVIVEDVAKLDLNVVRRICIVDQRTKAMPGCKLIDCLIAACSDKRERQGNTMAELNKKQVGSEGGREGTLSTIGSVLGFIDK